MDKLSMVYSHEEILYNKVNEHTSAHKHNLWKKPMKRGQILPLVLHNVSWVTFQVYRPPLNDWKGNIFCACILPISFYVTLRKMPDMYFLAPVSGPGHLLIESVECRNTDHLSLPFSQTSTWAAGGDNSLSLTHLKMPDFKVMVRKYKVLTDVRLLHIWQKSHIPTSVLLCFLRSSPQRTLGLYLGEASGICSHFWQPAQSSFSY